MTILIVTHNMQQAARVSDYTAYMYLGELIEFGVTDELFIKPKKQADRGLHHRQVRLKDAMGMTEHISKQFDAELDAIAHARAADGRPGRVADPRARIDALATRRRRR